MSPKKAEYEVICPVCKKRSTTTCPECAKEGLLICDHKGEVDVIELHDHNLRWKKVKK